MLNNALKQYFNSIEPSDDLIERTMIMAQNDNVKIRTFPKKALALLAAAIILAVSLTGYATVKHIFGNNEKGIVKEETDAGITSFKLDFSSADVTPEKYSDTNNPTVKKFIDAGYKNVVLPSLLTDEAVFSVGDVKYSPDGNLVMINFNNSDMPVSLFIFSGLSKEEMKNEIGIGGGEGADFAECYVKTYDGLDVQLSYNGAKGAGYSSYITYAVDDTLYMFNVASGDDIEHIKHVTEETAETLNNQ